MPHVLIEFAEGLMQVAKPEHFPRLCQFHQCMHSQLIASVIVLQYHAAQQRPCFAPTCHL